MAIRSVSLRRRLVSSVALALAVCSTSVHAQCPDGTAPPCRGAAASVARRVNPPLNARAWIVVPFSNVMKAQELEWLRDASVNLLSMDLGRWTDISVVPDKRVSDLLRELPPSRLAETLSLNDGLSIARRAGAGMLVMGDFFRLGKGARLVANVFDVKTGNRVRQVERQTTEQDSLLGAFGPLARGVLAVPPPPDAKTGELGTSQLGAYQAYLLGVKALNRFDLAESGVQFRRALAIDSLFALAHLQYSLLLGWSDASDGTTGEARTHALIAQRLGSGLPRRERMLIDARVASSGNDYTASCDVARKLVAQDSTDIQSLDLLGRCSSNDVTVEPSKADTTTGVFHNSWNTALRSFTKILELDPSYLGAFEQVLDILQSAQRGGRSCPTASKSPLDCTQWFSMVLRQGDSLVTVPVRAGSPQLFGAQYDRAMKERAKLTNLGIAEGIARRWFGSDSTSEAARFAVARVTLLKGDLRAADEQLQHLNTRATPENYAVLRARVEVAAKLGRGAESLAMFDSLAKAIPDNPSIATQRGAIELMFGRFGRFDRGVVAVATRLGPEAVAYQRQVGRALLGVPRETMARDEAAFVMSMRDSSCVGACRMRRIAPTMVYSLHKPVGGWATDSSLKGDGTLDAAREQVRADSAKLRRAAQSFEATSRDDIANGTYEFGYAAVASDAYLAVGDSAAALRMARFFVDSAMAFMPLATPWVPGIVSVSGSAFWPRMMLRRAELAAAAKQTAEAVTWYDRVLSLWADADAEMQPEVARIRAARAKLRAP